jgi:hypothetical protein
MPECNEIAVIYLLRYGNNPVLFKAFLSSIKKQPTSIDYIPIVIQKGFPSEREHPLAASWVTLQGRRAEVIHVSDEGLDLTAYRTAARRITASYCLFFNSYSRVLGPNWLETYVSASAQLGDHAVIGATGSWTSSDPAIPFPYPHLRTNAIFLKRELYLSFDDPLDRKEDCVRFESGRNSLSQSIIRTGGKIAMVGRSGQVVPPDAWPQSSIYYCDDQEQLLVSDNRSHGYQIAKPRSRQRFSKIAWGDRGTSIGRSWISRKILDWQWKLGKAVQ